MGGKAPRSFFGGFVRIVGGPRRRSLSMFTMVHSPRTAEIVRVRERLCRRDITFESGSPAYSHTKPPSTRSTCRRW